MTTYRSLKIPLLHLSPGPLVPTCREAHDQSSDGTTSKFLAGDDQENPKLIEESSWDDPLDPTRAPAPRSGKAGKAIHAVEAALTEGHQWWDAMLCVACTSIGQIILSYPYQMASTGIIAGVILKVGTDIISIYTLWLLVILFQHRKKVMVSEGCWYDSHDANGYRRRHTTTQMHDVIGFGGGRVLGIIAKIFIVISVLGTGIVQIVASSSSQYAVNKTYNKRTWSFIFGPIISMFAFLPTARSNRLLNIIGLAGTNYSCLYFFVNACSKGIDHSKILLRPPSTQRFFTGAAVMASGTGSFSAVMEITDSLRQSRKMDYAILLAVFWIMLLVIPHTTAVVLAYPHQALTKGNIYSILPPSSWRTTSVYIMLIHNIAAFTLHVQPLMFIWERFVHTQGLPYYFRLPSRLPVAGVIFLLALAIPFYGVLNSLASGLTDPSLAFILPCLAFSIFYWKKENRDHCPKFIPSFLKQRDWAPMFAINLVIMIVFAGLGGLEITYAVKTLVQDIHTFHWFAKCYQCAGST